jgi:hypothetical protein
LEENIKAKVIAKCWKDPEFKKRFLRAPEECLKEMGYYHADTKVKAIEDQENQFTFVIPAKPSSSENLTDTELEKMAAARDETSHLHFM